MKLRIEGWYSFSKQPFNHAMAVIDDKTYQFTVRELELENLHVLDLRRIVGPLLNPTNVVGVVDTKGSPNPFFIREEKAAKLKTLIELIDSVL